MLYWSWICWGPTMAVIADKCPDINVVVVDINKTELIME